MAITVPVESTEQRLVCLLSLFIASSYPTLFLTYRFLTENCPICIVRNPHHSMRCSNKNKISRIFFLMYTVVQPVFHHFTTAKFFCNMNADA